MKYVNPNITIIIDIIKYTKQNTSMDVSIMSNTLDFGNYTEEELSKYIDNIDFTLHGRNAIEHEEFCGAEKGLYDNVTKKLGNYIKLGVNVNIAINLIPKTYNKIYEMVKSMYECGVKFNTLLSTFNLE